MEIFNPALVLVWSLSHGVAALCVTDRMGSFQSRLEFVACVWLPSGAENSSLELLDRRLWLVWDIFGRFP